MRTRAMEICVCFVSAVLLSGCSELDLGPAGAADSGPDSGVVLLLDSSPAPDLGPAGAAGELCAAGSACASGYCVDGVCCDQACKGPCLSCALPGNVGRCSAAAKGSDPDQDCGGAHPSCGGTCDGAGQCTFVASGTQCDAPRCTAATLASSSCDGAGGCKLTSQSCGGYSCAADGKDCRASCSEASHCSGAKAQCVLGQCVADLPPGAACGANPLACHSGHCVNGTCCDQACAGACQSCTLAGKLGSCSFRALGTPCGAASSCVDGKLGSYLLLNRCSGVSATCSAEQNSCGRYRCAKQGAKCATSCTGHAQCAAGGVCDSWGLLGPKNSCVAASQVCHVNAKACPGTGQGTAAAPYCRIQDCLSKQTQAYVAVADGKYHEALMITRDVALVATGTTNRVAPGGLPRPKQARVKLVVPGVSPGILVGSAKAGAVKVLVHGFEISRSPAAAAGSVLVGVTTTGGKVWLSSALLHHEPGNYCLMGSSSAGQTLILDDVALWSCPVGISTSNTDLQLSRSGVGLTLGAVQHQGGALRARDLLVAGNLGSGVVVHGATLDLDRVRIGLNSGTGLVLSGKTSGQLTNTLVHQNGAGGVNLDQLKLPLTLAHITLANNSGVGLVCPASGVGATFHNSILWHSAAAVKQVHSGACLFANSVVKGLNVPAKGVISKDPLFDASSADDPFSLQSTSPCIDAGQDSPPGVSPHPAVDLLGKPRAVDRVAGGAKVDMGAYELQ